MKILAQKDVSVYVELRGTVEAPEEDGSVRIKPAELVWRELKVGDSISDVARLAAIDFPSLPLAEKRRVVGGRQCAPVSFSADGALQNFRQELRVELE